MAAIACLHGQPDSVYEGGNRHDEKYLKGVRKPNSERARSPKEASPSPVSDLAQASTGATLTTRRPRLTPKLTWPAARAKRVSSPPRPTFVAGVE